MSEPQAPSPRSRRRRVWIAIGILLGAALASLPWWVDDLARGLVARFLAESLDAEVRLDRLSLEARDRVVLEGLTIARPADFPPVERLEVGRLTLEAELRALLGGQARLLVVEDATVDLVPGPWPSSSDPSPLRYPRLDLGETWVTIRSDRGATSLRVAGQLSDDGSGPRGQVRAWAPDLDLAPILDLVTSQGSEASGDEAPPPGLQLGEGSGRLVGLDASIDLQEILEAAEIQLDHLEVADGGAQSLTLAAARLRLEPDGSRGVPSDHQDQEPQRLLVAAQRLEVQAVGARVELDLLDATVHLAGGPLPTSVEGGAQTVVIHRLPDDSEAPTPGTPTPETPTPETSAPPIRVEEPRLRFAPELVGSLAGPGSAPATWRGSLASAEVHLPTDPGAPEQQLTSARVDFVVTALDPAAGAEGPLRIAADAELPGVDTTRIEAEVGAEGTLDSLAVEWRNLRLERFLPWFEPRLAGLEGPCDGAVALGPASLVATLELPRLAGQLLTSTGPRTLPATLFPVRLEVESGRPGLDPALAGTAELTTALGRLEVGGQVALGSGSPVPGLTAPAPSGPASPSLGATWRWRGEPLERLLPPLARWLEVPLPDELAGQLAADGTLSGTFARPAVAAHLELTGLRVAASPKPEAPEAEPLRLVDASLRIDLAGTPGETLRGDRFELEGSIRVPGFEPLPTRLDARARWRPAESTTATSSANTLEVESFILDLAGARLMGSLAGSPLELEAGWSGVVEVEAPDLAALLALAESPPVPGFDFQGRLDGSFTITSETVATPEEAEGPHIRLTGPWGAQGLGFQSEDGARVLEGLSSTGTLTVLWHPEAGWTAEARADASGFLLLWETLFADFSSASPRLTGRAEGGPEGFQRARWQLDPAPSTRLVATVEADAGSTGLPWTLDVEALDLAALHDALLLPALGGDKVGEALSGRLLAHLAGRLESLDAWSLRGDVEVEALSWRRGELLAEGVALELPLDLAKGKDRISGQRRTGWLAFEKLASGPFELPAVGTVLWTEGDALGLESSLELPLYGGRVRIEGLTLDDLLGTAPSLVAGLDLEALDLATLANDYDFLPLEGSLEGRLPRLRLADTEQGSVLTVDGGGEIRLFDGVVRVHGITGRDLLSPFPRITLSADLESIDLGQFTRKIDFGEMTGVLEGSIEDCELFRGLPVTCRAHLETIERKGVRRTVDVKAVNNLTILGTGQGNLFDRGLRRFFKRFTYDKLLLDLELANDVLLLRGQPVRGDREVFLSGRLPFPIEVVNAQPGRTVSFETMRRRLESLDFEGVTTSP